VVDGLGSSTTALNPPFIAELAGVETLLEG